MTNTPTTLPPAGSSLDMTAVMPATKEGGSISAFPGLAVRWLIAKSLFETLGCSIIQS